VPPETPIVPEYAIPTVASGGSLSVNVELAGLIVRVICDELLACGALESVADTVSTKEPEALGVPLMLQLDPRDRPVGSDPLVMLQLYGPVPPFTGMAEE
jgi:hypothetical protein